MGQVSRYAFTNAKVRAMLSSLLSPQTLDQLMETRDIQEALDILSKSAYNDVLTDKEVRTADLKDVEKLLLTHDVRLISRLQSALPNRSIKDFVSLYIQRYEIEMLKVMLRIWHRKIPVNPEDYFINEKVCFDIDYRQVIAAKSLEEIIVSLDHTPYHTALIQGREKYKKTKALFYLETALDADYYRRLALVVEGFPMLDRKIARSVLGAEIDIENINRLVRLKKYYGLTASEMMDWVIPGGARVNRETYANFFAGEDIAKSVASSSFGPYEKIRELLEENVELLSSFLFQILQGQVKKALAGFPFTIGTVLGYLIMKSCETRNIVSLLYAKSYGWGKEQIEPILTIC